MSTLKISSRSKARITAVRDEASGDFVSAPRELTVRGLCHHARRSGLRAMVKVFRVGGLEVPLQELIERGSYPSHKKAQESGA